MELVTREEAHRANTLAHLICERAHRGQGTTLTPEDAELVAFCLALAARLRALGGSDQEATGHG